MITKINIEHNSIIVTYAGATEEHSLLSRSQGELSTQVTCQKTIKPISTCEASSTLPASLVCESFFWSCQESDLKKKSTAGEDEAGIYNNKKNTHNVTYYLTAKPFKCAQGSRHDRKR